MALGNVELVKEVKNLIASFRKKGKEFSQILKMGRTQLQDAVPMTLGQEFEAFAATLSGEVLALERIQNVLCEINMGATAIGTGLNAPEGYAEKCTKHLAKITGFPIHLAEDLIEATQDTQSYVLYSSCMKSLAIKLSKVCNDLRLLSSGPRCGLREINLPAKQPGSSIMPGKVNPVIPEVISQVCFRVIGSDMTVTMSAEAGQLQLNAFEPVIAACIFEAQTMFINAARTLRVHCVDGITANPDVLKHYVEYSIGTVTALNPVIGYDKSTELAAEAMKTGKGILELIREKKVLTEDADREGLQPGRDDGAGASGMSRRAPLRACVLASALLGARPAAQGEQPAPDGWRPFTATWTLSGQSSLLPTEGERPASIVHLDGPPDDDERRGARPRPARRGDRLRRRREAAGGPRRLHRRARRSDLLRSRGRADRNRPPGHGDDHGRHRALRRARRERFSLRLAVRRGRPESGEVSVRAVNIEGRTRRAGSPARRRGEPRHEDPARAPRRRRARRRRSGSGPCPRDSLPRPGISLRSLPRRSPPSSSAPFPS